MGVEKKKILLFCLAPLSCFMLGFAEYVTCREVHVCVSCPFGVACLDDQVTVAVHRMQKQFKHWLGTTAECILQGRTCQQASTASVGIGPAKGQET